MPVYLHSWRVIDVKCLRSSCLCEVRESSSSAHTSGFWRRSRLQGMLQVLRLETEIHVPRDPRVPAMGNC